MFDRLTWESGRDLRRFLMGNVGKDFDSVYSLLCSRFRNPDQRRLLDRLVKILVERDVVNGEIIWVKKGIEQVPFYETTVSRYKHNLVRLTKYPIFFINEDGILSCIHPIDSIKEVSDPTYYKLDRCGFKWLVRRNDGSWWVFYYRNKSYREAYWHVETHICGGLKKYDTKTSTDRSKLEVIENHKFKIVRNYGAFRRPKKTIYNRWERLTHYFGRINVTGSEPYHFGSLPNVDGYLVRVKRVSNDFAKKAIMRVK